MRGSTGAWPANGAAPALPVVGRARPNSRLLDSRLIGPLLLGTLLAIGLTLLGDRLLGDPDTHWHVALGQRIWRDGAVPWLDDYTHTVAGQPWIAKEWLSQLLLFAAHAAAGWRGPVALTALALGALFALLFGWLAARTRSTVALAATLAAVIFVAPHFLARPHVFALPTLFWWTTGLVAAAERGRPPRLHLLLCLVVWANLHGSFTLAYPLLGLLAVEAVASAPTGRRLAAVRGWATFAGLSLLAGCVTPYGIASMAVTVTIFGSGESLPFVTEWQPLALDATGLAALGAAALLFGALAREPVRNAWRMAGILGLTAMTLRHGRFLDMFAVVAPILAAGPLARRWPALGPEGDASAAGRTRPVILGSLLAGLVAAFVAVTAMRDPAPAPNVTPEAALAAARRLGATGPVYNDYDFGGFLIARGVPTFIDGRTDQLFLGGFISGLYRAVRAEESGPFLALLDRSRVEWALVKPGSPEARHLDRAPGWRRGYADRDAAVYLRG